MSQKKYFSDFISNTYARFIKTKAGIQSSSNQTLIDLQKRLTHIEAIDTQNLNLLQINKDMFIDSDALYKLYDSNNTFLELLPTNVLAHHLHNNNYKSDQHTLYCWLSDYIENIQDDIFNAVYSYIPHASLKETDYILKICQEIFKVIDSDKYDLERKSLNHTINKRRAKIYFDNSVKFFFNKDKLPEDIFVNHALKALEYGLNTKTLAEMPNIFVLLENEFEHNTNLLNPLIKKRDDLLGLINFVNTNNSYVKNEITSKYEETLSQLEKDVKKFQSYIDINRRYSTKKLVKAA